MIPIYLTDSLTGGPLRTASTPFIGDGKGDTLIISTLARALGVYKSVSVTGASTTTIADPVPGGSIALTDIIVSAKKKAASTIIIQWDDDDDNNTVILMAPDIISAPANIVWSPQGLIRGWKNARLEIITDATFDVTVTAAYVKLVDGLEFATWDALR